MKVEVLSEDAIAAHLRLIDFSAAVRDALVRTARGEADHAPVARLAGPDAGSGVNLKFASVANLRLIGGKVGTWWPSNVAHALPPHAASTLLLDADTGMPRAIVAARTLNRWRTAEADAWAVDALTDRASDRLALIGAGGQAEFEARAIARRRRLKQIRIGARKPESGERLAAALSDLGAEIEVCTIEGAVRDAEIIVTVTPAREPLVMSGWVRAGAHISAMGADAVGKQELDPALFARAAVFADLPSQSVVVGECQHAHLLGSLQTAEITSLGDFLADAGRPQARSGEITIFDSSGIAAQDLLVAEAALDALRPLGLVQSVEL